MAQEVTIGRIVHYKDAEGKTLPAIVVAVNEEQACCLQVFGMDRVFPAHVVSQGEGNGQWDWMPFQKDQQKSVELLEKQIEDLQSEVDSTPETIEVENTTPEVQPVEVKVDDTLTAAPEGVLEGEVNTTTEEATI